MAKTKKTMEKPVWLKYTAEEARAREAEVARLAKEKEEVARLAEAERLASKINFDLS